MEKLNQEIKDIKKQLNLKYFKMGKNIQLEMLFLNVDFLLHSAINNAFEQKDSKERLKLYLNYLKMRLKD